jgi:hypothetical protein
VFGGIGQIPVVHRRIADICVVDGHDLGRQQNGAQAKPSKIWLDENCLKTKKHARFCSKMRMKNAWAILSIT